MLKQKIQSVIRDVPDFPKEGIIFKDITPILADSTLCFEVVNAFVEELKGLKVDVIAGVESRGFLFGMMLANALKVPFVPIRKKGKLPYEVVSYRYDLEYGSAEVEMHVDAIQKDWNVLVHDDLLATGGTASASAELIKKLGGVVCGFAFVIELSFLNGKEMLNDYTENTISLVKY
ncbi:MAG: adenine phosphoribosyltransferase [Flavobacteriales bacterium]|nr:adenine phosphoribosyltransferase [Flavobacteriales bacterium]|tara:strand:+ start:471 stop:998 length:528 start_codon:yes stop_codon:yes gene_type:complete